MEYTLRTTDSDWNIDIQPQKYIFKTNTGRLLPSDSSTERERKKEINTHSPVLKQHNTYLVCVMLNKDFPQVEKYTQRQTKKKRKAVKKKKEKKNKTKNKTKKM